jgi:hypothetical protein
LIITGDTIAILLVTDDNLDERRMVPPTHDRGTWFGTHFGLKLTDVSPPHQTVRTE